MCEGYRASAVWIGWLVAAFALGAAGCAGSTEVGGEDGGTPTSEGVECVPGEPPIAPNLLPECGFCPDARCVPNFALEEDQIAMLAPCDDNNTCVPELFIETNGQFLLTRCTSLNGAEGRCLSPCIPAVSNQADLLPADVCTDGWLCAPCYDPLTGEDTGACRQSCDPGPTEEPVVFPECCGGLGSCVSESLVSEEQAAQLGVDTCTGDGILCAPKDLANPTYTPPRCDSVGGAEGRCLPECLPDIAAQASLLPQSTCDPGHLCAPCYDPTAAPGTSPEEADTGACRLNGDEPEDPPYAFPYCCGGGGRCVPAEVVPEGQRDQLGSDGCDATAGELCVPNVFVEDPSWSPPSCDPGDSNVLFTSFSDEGRCLPECIPDVSDPGFGLQFNQSSCDPDFLCTPCTVTAVYFLDIDTGACDL
jgi:hypothetical protein